MSFIEYELRELGEIITGKTPKKSDEQFYNSNDVLFIKPDDLILNNIKYISKANSYVSFNGAATGRIVKKGTILVTCIGVIGKVGIVDCDKAIFNQQINAIIPNENIVIGKYLAYVLQSMQRKLQDRANAPIVPILNKSNFSKINVSIPNLEYQKRVVQILDESQMIIEKRQSQIRALNELSQSIFAGIFKNEKCRIEKLSDNVVGITSGKSLAGESVAEYKVINTSAVSYKEFDSSKSKFLPLGYVPPESHLVKKGDILISRMNTSELVGAVAYVFDEPSKLAIPDRIWKLEVDENKLAPIYTWYYLNQPYFRKLVTRISSGTSGSMKNISQTKYLNLEIKVPSLEVQKEFSRKLIAIRAQKIMLENALTEMQDLYNSLLQKAFRGELFQEAK
ncbi:restriction endonuclease subunit S [Lysinibacillus xylanilyticus]|uniref:restriction endonuclease subunit S n=1 Tax=Lysinibacillus xylanilyticus TaxID=582475 RepID=UPI0036D78DAA